MRIFDFLAFLMGRECFFDLPVFALIPNWQLIQLAQVEPNIAFVGIVD